MHKWVQVDDVFVDVLAYRMFFPKDDKVIYMVPKYSNGADNITCTSREARDTELKRLREAAAQTNGQ